MNTFHKYLAKYSDEKLYVSIIRKITWFFLWKFKKWWNWWFDHWASRVILEWVEGDQNEKMFDLETLISFDKNNWIAWFLIARNFMTGDFRTS